VIEREFQDAEGAKAIGSSHGYFGLVVQPLDHTAGKLLPGLEIVEQQGTVSAQRAGDFLHWLDTGAQGLIAPEVQEHAGPGGRVVFPKLLKIVFEEIGTDGLEIVSKQISQTELLLRGEILFTLEYAPARLLQ
jgi:hypothetical protein